MSSDIRGNRERERERVADCLEEEEDYYWVKAFCMREAASCVVNDENNSIILT